MVENEKGKRVQGLGMAAKVQKLNQLKGRWK